MKYYHFDLSESELHQIDLKKKKRNDIDEPPTPTFEIDKNADDSHNSCYSEIFLLENFVEEKKKRIEKNESSETSA